MDKIVIADSAVLHRENYPDGWYPNVHELVKTALTMGKRYAMHNEWLLDLTDIGHDWGRSVIWSKSKGWIVDGYEYRGRELNRYGLYAEDQQMAIVARIAWKSPNRNTGHGDWLSLDLCSQTLRFIRREYPDYEHWIEYGERGG